MSTPGRASGLRRVPVATPLLRGEPDRVERLTTTLPLVGQSSCYVARKSLAQAPDAPPVGPRDGLGWAHGRFPRASSHLPRQLGDGCLGRRVSHTLSEAVSSFLTVGSEIGHRTRRASGDAAARQRETADPRSPSTPKPGRDQRRQGRQERRAPPNSPRSHPVPSAKRNPAPSAPAAPAPREGTPAPDAGPPREPLPSPSPPEGAAPPPAPGPRRLPPPARRAPALLAPVPPGSPPEFLQREANHERKLPTPPQARQDTFRTRSQPHAPLAELDPSEEQALRRRLGSWSRFDRGISPQDFDDVYQDAWCKLLAGERNGRPTRNRDSALRRFIPSFDITSVECSAAEMAVWRSS
jgi:hypothetical protein